MGFKFWPWVKKEVRQVALAHVPDLMVALQGFEDQVAKENLKDPVLTIVEKTLFPALNARFEAWLKGRLS